MVEIRNQEDLEQWLQGRSREEAVAIAVRAALRVTPLIFLRKDIKQFRDYILLSSWRAIDATIFSVNFKERGVVGASTRLRIVVYATTTLENIADAAKGAASGAVSAAAGSHELKVVTNSAGAVNTASIAADPFTSSIIWNMASKDVLTLTLGASPQGLLASPLWPDGAPDWALESWRDLKADLSQFPEEKWEVWTEWYEDRLEGRPIDWDLQRKRVMTPYDEKLWEQGPAKVNARIKEIIAEHNPHPEIEEAPPKIEEPEAQDSRVLRIKRDGDGFALDGASDVPIPDNDFVASLETRAQKALQKLISATDGKNYPFQIQVAEVAWEALEAFTAQPNEKPHLIAAGIANLEDLQGLDDDFRNTPSDDVREQPLLRLERLALNKAVADCLYLVALVDEVKRFYGIYRAAPTAPFDPEAATELFEKAEEAAILPEDAAEKLQAIVATKSEGARLTVGNFLKALAVAGAAIVLCHEVAQAIQAFITTTGPWIVANWSASEPVLTRILQQIIDALGKITPL